jgi:hypothetical protein
MTLYKITKINVKHGGDIINHAIIKEFNLSNYKAHRYILNVPAMRLHCAHPKRVQKTEHPKRIVI